jgi:long-chain acyl-CoA synthetase
VVADGAILLTGATGFLGGELLARLLSSRPGARMHCLVRARDEAHLEQRRRELLTWAGIADADAPRVVAVAGALEQPDLGLGVAYPELAERVTEVFHTAASTRLDLPLDEARRLNTRGAEHVLQFARAAQRTGGLQRLHHVSTAFVLARPGAEPGRFRNSYEQSKWEAEQTLERAQSELAITCYRPSIVMGDSRSGRTPHFRVLYEPIRWVYTGQTKLLPVRPDLRVDVVPVDYVCDAILELAGREDGAGKTYPLTAGPDRAISVAEMIDLAVKAGNAYHAEIGLGPTPEPEIVSPEILERTSG